MHPAAKTAPGLPGYAAHGLRKAGARRLAERGATAQQLLAYFGWMTLKEAERDTRHANRKKLTGEAAQLIGSLRNSEAVSNFSRRRVQQEG